MLKSVGILQARQAQIWSPILAPGQLFRVFGVLRVFMSFRALRVFRVLGLGCLTFKFKI